MSDSLNSLPATAVSPRGDRPYGDLTIQSETEAGRLAAVRERFDKLHHFWNPIHNTAKEDDAFIQGDQWPGEVRRERERDKRPVLTYNRLPSNTRIIVDAIRKMQ